MTKTTTTTGKTEAKAKRTAKRTPKPKAGSDGSKHWAYAGVADGRDEHGAERLPMAIAIDCGLVYCEWATLDG